MRLIYAYLRIVLFLGFKSYVYNLSRCWGSREIGIRRFHAACSIQKELFKRGYFKCPSCEWATEVEDEHVNRGEGTCWEQLHGNPDVPWDEELDPQLAYEKMPTMLDHWPTKGETQMFFILSKKYQQDGKPMFDQLGIVVADSIEQAAEKVGLPIVHGCIRQGPLASWIETEKNFHLDSIPEWNGALPDDASYAEPYRPSDNIKVPIASNAEMREAGIE